LTRTTALRRGLVAALAAVAAAAGPLPQLAHAGTAPAAPAEATIPAKSTTGPVGLAVVASDAGGYVLQGSRTFTSGTQQYTWSSADGTVSRDLGKLAQPPTVVPLPGGGSVVATVDDGTPAQPAHRVDVYDVASGTWTRVDVPSGRSVVGVVPTGGGWTAVAKDADGALHLLTPAAGGGLDDTPVSGQPAGGIGGIDQWRAVDGAMAFLTSGTTSRLGLLDTDTGVLTFLGADDSSDGSTLLLSDDVFGVYDPATGTATLRAVDTPQTVVADLAATLPGGGLAAPILTDKALVMGRVYAGIMPGQTPGPVESFPLDGSAPAVLTTRGGTPAQAADGGVTYDAPTASGGWATYRLPPSGGPAVVLRDYTIYHPEPIGLSLDRGRLSRVETGPGYEVQEHLENADLGTGATPEPKGPVEEAHLMPWDAIVNRCGGLRCAALTDTDTAFDTADGAAPVFLSTNLLGADTLEQEGVGAGIILGTSPGRIISADGTTAVYDGAADGQQYLVDLAKGQVARTRPAVAAALWNGTLWSATPTPGTFTTESTVALTGTPGPTAAVTTDVPCVPDELQVLGRWLYWSCGADGPAGVYDATRGHSVRVPAGKALLGDGFVLQHTGGHLVLTDVHTGAAAGRTLADLPAGSYPDDRGITWTVDKYRGFVAYTDAAGTTHVLPPGVPASPLTVLRDTVSPTAAHDAVGWQPRWTFTGPVSSWRLDVRKRGQSTVVASFHGGAARGTVSVHWDTRYPTGMAVPGGAYTWTLSAVPADADGPPLSTTGTLTVAAGPARDRDFTGDGVGDLLALTSAGRLDIRPGTGAAPGGVRATSSSGTGWPASSRLVPTGDLNGDGHNDLLVRDASGTLTCYYGSAGHAFTPGGAHRRIGGGWNIYDQLTSPGDTTGDGRPDLFARDTHGDLYVYRATSAGVFAPRIKIGYGYQTYDLLVGVQDLRIAPEFPTAAALLGRDRAGVLWLYGATGHGGLTGRVRVGGGWQVYNSLVGVADLNGDGRNDLVARDAHGDLWRYDGLNNERFAARVRIGWGWQVYRALV
jgi:hypothetical protein